MPITEDAPVLDRLPQAEREAAFAQNRPARQGGLSLLNLESRAAISTEEAAWSLAEEREDNNFRTADVSFFSIIDGHNGDAAALWARKFLYLALAPSR